MKNKNKKGGLFLFGILLVAGFFGFETKAETSDHLVISEILIGGEKAAEEFIEIYNPTPEEINLETLPLKLHTLNSNGSDTAKTITLNKKFISAGGYFVISSKEYKEKFSNYVDAFYGGGVLAKGWSIYISKSKDESVDIIDMIKWEECDKNYSYSFNGADWKCTSILTPGEKNQFDKIVPPMDAPAENTVPVGNTQIVYKVYLTEIVPNPKGDEKMGEFVEIYNAGETDTDISGWMLKDSSKTKYVFPAGTKIKSGKYSIIYRDDFKFAMNNSGKETISLWDKNNREISSVSYATAKENVSYNFDGAYWHWSRFLTPGTENKFNQAPKIKLNKPKDNFVGVPVIFEASVKDKDKDKIKYAWDFGDGHKSYLKNTTHSFLKKGNYSVIFTADDGSEKFSESLNIKIKNYPKADVKIVELSPNPSGSDAGNEKITLLNNSKKKINLKNWSIATGNKKTLINHLIAKDFFISPGKTANLTKKDAAFFLKNTAMKIELRYPNGKTADKLAYKKEKITDDEIYTKTNGQWAWIAPQNENKKVAAEATEKTNVSALIAIKHQDAEIIPDNPEIQANLGKYSESVSWQTKKENKIILASYNSKNIASRPQARALAVPKVRESENHYFFTPPTILEKHWVVKILENMNVFLNSLLNFS